MQIKFAYMTFVNEEGLRFGVIVTYDTSGEQNNVYIISKYSKCMKMSHIKDV